MPAGGGRQSCTVSCRCAPSPSTRSRWPARKNTGCGFCPIPGGVLVAMLSPATFGSVSDPGHASGQAPTVAALHLQYRLSPRPAIGADRSRPAGPDALRPVDRNVIASYIASLPASKNKSAASPRQTRAYPLVQLDENCPAMNNDRAVHFCFLPTCIYSKTPNGVGNLLTGRWPEQGVPGATGFFLSHHRARPTRGISFPGDQRCICSHIS